MILEHSVDVAVIGAGPAGLAAAVSSKKHNARKVVILDRNSWLGGILPQCIHDGFGVEETGMSMTGPEYAEMYIKQLKKLNISVMKETMALSINKKKEIFAVNKDGLHTIKAKSIILSMGCREKTRYNVMIPGDRPSGVFTAGVAQSFINLYNIMPGKNIVILGSGDVGLIMARRLKFEGANVLGVIEILPYASGLPRNVVQCLDDYDIPIYLNHTIIRIQGRERVENVTIAQVDKKCNIVPGSEKKLECDTLLLSLGLIPENELSEQVGIILDDKTGGPMVDQFYETNIKGIFSCGNCLQVYDTVDVLAKHAKETGRYAAQKTSSTIDSKQKIHVSAGKDIRYVIPQHINHSGCIHFSLRVVEPKQSVNLKVRSKEKELYTKHLRWINPANMVEFDIRIQKDDLTSLNDLEVFIDG